MPADDAVNAALLAQAVKDVKETVAKLGKDMHESNAALEQKLEAFVIKAVYEAHNTLLDLRLSSIESKFDSRLKLIEKIVFGTIGLICMAVVIALLALVIKGGVAVPRKVGG